MLAFTSWSLNRKQDGQWREMLRKGWVFLTWDFLSATCVCERGKRGKHYRLHSQLWPGDQVCSVNSFNYFPFSYSFDLHQNWLINLLRWHRFWTCCCCGIAVFLFGWAVMCGSTPGPVLPVASWEGAAIIPGITLEQSQLLHICLPSRISPESPFRQLSRWVPFLWSSVLAFCVPTH